MQKNYILYARKSSESEDRQVLSIESQINELKKIASKNGLTICHEFRESKSAKTLGRPLFESMMKMLKRSDVHGIICWKLDRLARNPIDGGKLIWGLDQGQIKEIVTHSRSFKKSGDDAFWMQLEFGMAKKYVDDLSDNVRRGLRTKAENGEPPMSRLPIGYRRNQQTKKAEPDPENFKWVKRIWDEILLEYHSPSEILEIARTIWSFHTPVTGRFGGNLLSKSSFYRLLKNPFYMGVYNCQGEVYKGKYPTMVTPENFNKVQRILGRKNQPRPKTHKEFSYRGLLSCQACGRKMTAEEKINRHGSKYIYYHCARTFHSFTKCSEPYLEEKSFEKQAIKWCENLSIDLKFINWSLKHIENMDDDESRVCKLQQVKREANLRSLEKQIKNLRRMRLLDHITNDEYLEEKQTLLLQKESIQKALQNSNSAYGTIEPLERLFSFAKLAKKRFAEGDQMLNRRILITAGSNFFIKDRKVFIQTKKPFQIIMERPSSASMHAWCNHVRTSLAESMASGEIIDIPDLREN